jgi:hypothetical protein
VIGVVTTLELGAVSSGLAGVTGGFESVLITGAKGVETGAECGSG